MKDESQPIKFKFDHVFPADVTTDEVIDLFSQNFNKGT